MTTRLSSFAFFGGKSNMLSKLLALFPPHDHYVEPFGGSGVVILNKKPCGGVETYNDLDSSLYDFFMTIADPALFEQFKRRVQYLPWSRELFDECRSTWHEQTDRIERVWRWWVVARQSFSGIFGSSWMHSTNTDTKMCTSKLINGLAKLDAVHERLTGTWHSSVNCARAGTTNLISAQLGMVEKLPEIHGRLQRIQIENRHALEVLKTYDGPGYLAYCDPPYVLETRSAGGYTHEMTDEDHKKMIEALIQYQGAVVLSGYQNSIYEALDTAGWHRNDIDTTAYSAAKTKATGNQGAGASKRLAARTESIWRNPECLRRLAVARPENAELF